MASDTKVLVKPIHMIYPYDITIRTNEDAADYVMNQCKKCPKYADGWNCSTTQSYECKLIAYNLARTLESPMVYKQ